MIDPALDLLVLGGAAWAFRRRGDRWPIAVGKGLLAVRGPNLVIAVVVLALT